MNKAELVDAVATAANLSKADAGRAVDAVVNSITASLKKGQQVVRGRIRHVRCQAPGSPRRSESAHRGDDQDRREQRPRVQSWQGIEGCRKLTGSVPRVLSSAGRASPLQGEGRGFDPLSTHQELSRSGSSAG